MCGINGILNGDDPAADRARVARMVGIQRHRGPDGAAVRTFPGAALGHNRLSIIDRTPAAAQPMTSHDGRHAIVLNGEIYNYLELYRDLAGGADAYPFCTSSDTEVLLAAFRRWGRDCLARVNGMFAFCIYDTVTREAFLARDRFGQKLLVYAFDGPSVIFASEAKALFVAGVPRRPCWDSWGRYLSQAATDDGRQTFFDGIYQLRPGEYATFAPGTDLRLAQYYTLPEAPAGPVADIDDAAGQLRDRLVRATAVHMRSDVPIGISLSGGLDSSALLACLDLAGGLRPTTPSMSVDFGDDYSEAAWIVSAVRHHRIQGYLDHFSPRDFEASIRPLMWHLESPIGGLMNCALIRVMSRSRQCGARVLQDGTGLDEAFGGYRSLHAVYVGHLLRSRGRGDEALRGFAGTWQCSTADATAECARASSGSEVAIDGTALVRRDLLTTRLLRAGGVPTADPAPRDPLRAAMHELVGGSKIPRNMRMKERTSAAYGIEMRMPFLDPEVVEFGINLAGDLLFHAGQPKSVVRQALAGLMPDDVRLATKRSVHAPQGLWLRSAPMRSYVNRLVRSESFRDRGAFDPSRVEAAFEEFCREGGPNSFFIWQWINMEEWFRVFIDDDPTTTRIPLGEHERDEEAFGDTGEGAARVSLLA